MKFMSFCENCKASNVCKSKIENITVSDKFDNILIYGNCEAHITSIPYYRNLYRNFHDEFNHCETCTFSPYCKLYNNPDMMREIESIQIYCKLHGYKDLQYTCTSYEPKPIIEIPKKKSFWRKFKKGHKNG